MHAAVPEFTFEIMLCPVRRGWCSDQAHETLSQWGALCPTLIFSVIRHPSLEFSISWGVEGRGKRSSKK